MEGYDMRVFRQKDSCIAVGSVCLSHVQGWKGAETGDAGDGPSHGSTGRGRAGEDLWGVPSMRGITGIQGEGAESGSRKEREGRRLWNCGEEGYLNICTLFGESH